MELCREGAVFRDSRAVLACDPCYFQGHRKRQNWDHSSLENPHGKHSSDLNAPVFLFEPLLHYAIESGAVTQTLAAF